MKIEEIELHDLRQMFQNSLVRYNTEPVMIGHVSAGFRADCVFIGNNEEQVLDLRDEKFDFKPVNTGYVNLQGYSFFITRLPRRQWKQGLSKDNVEIKYNLPYADDGRFEKAYHRVVNLDCKPLYNTIKNIYPSLAQAVESFEDNNVEIAFDRQFCVNKNGMLFYKGSEVGKVDLNTLKIEFKKEFHFLEKAL